MATIEATFKVGPKCVLMAYANTDREKLRPLKQGQEVQVKITTEKRSLSSNALSHQWYKDVADQTDEVVEDVMCFCKLHYGVPILRAESDKFRDTYDSNIKDFLTYEQKLGAMSFIAVTRLMNKGQMNRYLNDMQRDYATRGVILETPKDAEYSRWITAQANK